MTDTSPFDRFEHLAREQFTADAGAFDRATIINDGEALDELVRLADIAADTKVLDVASGPGIVAVRLAQSGARVTGVDLTPAMLDIARRRADAAGVDLRLLEGSMYRLPFDDDEFDVVVSRYALHHAHDLEAAVREIDRVARPGARLVIVDFAADPDPAIAAAYDEAERHRDPSHARNLTVSEQREAFGALGWDVLERSTYRLPASVGGVLTGSNGPDHESFRRAFEESLTSHGLGVGARRAGDDIAFDYPIVAQAFGRSIS
ncbi:MAG: methyltransferase domain-containing protein [Acidimicrobiales bacterium]